MEDTLRVAQQQPEKQDCPNRNNHVTAFSDYGGVVRCPVCSAYPMQTNEVPVYVRVEHGN